MHCKLYEGIQVFRQKGYIVWYAGPCNFLSNCALYHTIFLINYWHTSDIYAIVMHIYNRYINPVAESSEIDIHMYISHCKTAQNTHATWQLFATVVYCDTLVNINVVCANRDTFNTLQIFQRNHSSPKKQDVNENPKCPRFLQNTSLTVEACYNINDTKFYL